MLEYAADRLDTIFKNLEEENEAFTIFTENESFCRLL